MHFELLASEKLLTEFATLVASLASVAIWPADGFDGSAFAALAIASTYDLMELVSLGKSLLAELTRAVASLWIFLSCDCKALIPLLAFKLRSPLTEFSRLVRSEQ